MKHHTGKFYEFGHYRLDLGERRLWREGHEIKLRPKVFDLLHLLIDHCGQMVEKEEIIKRLWPDVAVEDNVITVTINELRSALSDGKFIETVTKRGYRFAAEVALVYGDPSEDPGASRTLQPPGGAVPLQSHLYITRPADEEFCRAIARHDSIVLVKGARQVGKTSLLARGLEDSRNQGASVILIDFQQFNSTAFETADKLLLSMAELISFQLDLSTEPHQAWNAFLGPSSNFERFLRREVLAKKTSHVVWGLDEVDRLFNYSYASEIFGLFRSWHNLRALDPRGPLSRLTLAIAYATEAHLFITDLNQSPFNVGTRLLLEDFTFEQVLDLNARYGGPLQNDTEAAGFHALLNGHPYLTQRGLYEIAKGHATAKTIEEQGDLENGLFGDHLQRMLVSIEQDPDLREEFRNFLKTGTSLSNSSFSRLRSAGIIFGDSASNTRLRCELYARYLKRHLA